MIQWAANAYLGIESLYQLITDNPVASASSATSRSLDNASLICCVQKRFDGYPKPSQYGIDSEQNNGTCFFKADVSKMVSFVPVSASDFARRATTGQFSTRRLGTRENSRTFADTSVKSRARAWAAKNRSFSPMGCPAWFRSTLIFS